MTRLAALTGAAIGVALIGAVASTETAYAADLYAPGAAYVPGPAVVEVAPAPAYVYETPAPAFVTRAPIVRRTVPAPVVRAMPGYLVSEPRTVVIEPRAAIVAPHAVVVERPPEYVLEAPAYESTLTARALRYSDPYVDVGYGRSCMVGIDGFERCY